jgi:hypothetical protein
MTINQIDLAREKYRFDLITNSGNTPKDTCGKRDCLTEFYLTELYLDLQGIGDDVSEREVYESFSKRHRLVTVPDSYADSRVMLRKKLGEKEPWLINKIYKEKKEEQRKSMTGVIARD